MRRERLSDRFIVIQYSDLRADELHNPDRRRISRPYVPEAAVFHQRVRSDLANPSGSFRFGQVLGVIRTFSDSNVIAFPDVGILLGLHPKAVQALLLKLGGKPRVLVPIGMSNDRPGWKLVASQHYIHRIIAKPRVPTEPQFAARLTNGRP